MLKKYALYLVALSALINAGCITFTPEFQLDEIEKIELLKIGLGEVVQRKELEKQFYLNFYKALNSAKYQGTTKMFTCYRIQVQTRNGQILTFRTNGHQFFSPHDDTLYEFRGDKNIAEKYWAIKPDCSDLSNK